MDPAREQPAATDDRCDYLRLKSVTRDRVTGLPAFQLLFDDLRTALDQRRNIGVIQVETINLGLIESLYGWQMFDRVMAHVAAAVRGAVGAELPESSLVALNRVAGDRVLAFVLEGSRGEEVDTRCLRNLGDSLVERLSVAFDHDVFAGLNPEIRFRSGQALLFLDPFYRFERQVYSALAQATESLKRRASLRELSGNEELRKIIRESAVDAVLQPVVALGSGRIHGYEAFARGPRNSQFETPRAMFAMSGRLGLDRELDRLCMAAALRASAESAHGRKLFVNVLPEVLPEVLPAVRPAVRPDGGHRGDAGADLASLLRQHGLDPADLVVELRERSAERDPAAFFGSVDRFRAAGFGVAIDDVGTGFGSRELIQRARPDFVKLDESLVRGVHENLIKQELLASLVDLASETGASVIAECVETGSEAATLTQAGAEYAQGYWFAAPAPPFPGLAAGGPAGRG